MGIIYCYHNIITGKKYIGQTTIKWEQYRKSYHKTIINRKLKHRSKFANAVIKYGWDTFIYGIIESTELDNLDQRECYWIEQHDCVNNGYNILEGGNAPRGYKMPEHTRQAIIKANTGRPMNERTRQAIINANTGRRITEETRQKLRDSSSNRDRSNYNYRTKQYALIKHNGEVEFIDGMRTYALKHDIDPGSLRTRLLTTHKRIRGLKRQAKRINPLPNGILYVLQIHTFE